MLLLMVVQLLRPSDVGAGMIDPQAVLVHRLKSTFPTRQMRFSIGVEG